MTEPTPSDDDELDLSIREILDFIWSAFTSDDEATISSALDTWTAVHTPHQFRIRVTASGEVDITDFAALTARRQRGTFFVVWRLLEFMSEETGRPLADLLAEFEERIARRLE